MATKNSQLSIKKIKSFYNKPENKSKLIDDIILVSKDETAFGIGKKFNCIQIIDDEESGVNNAVSLANEFLVEHDYDCSVVLPQDIPLVSPHDLDSLVAFYQNKKNAIIVPSRHFDGTNALVRKPVPRIETRYDEGSYKFQFEPLKTAKINYSLALIHSCLLYTSPSPRDLSTSRMPSSA